MHQHCKELCLRGLHLRIVCTVDHENDSMRVCIIGIPGGPQVFLTTEIPHLEPQILMLHLFDVTPDSRLGHNYFIKGQLVQYSGLSRVIHADYYDFELHVAAAQTTQSVPNLRKDAPHYDTIHSILNY